MTTIILLAIAAMLTLERFGPGSSVGGPMSMLLVLVLIILGVTAHEAKSRERDEMRRGICIVVSIIGGVAAFILIALSIDAIEPYLPIEGPLDSSEDPVKYALVAATAIVVVLGSWLPLRAMNRLRSHEKAAPGLRCSAVHHTGSVPPSAVEPRRRRHD
ncbi:hypothetical protein [Bradyrhizobium sp. 1]|uniref:hypothetical protein n=1 Tax=Bradyrhizobium sp. 1 TaxID=241591 RepID=UPI001FF8697E|nr:hypothetical protein [Bradyrhizobium sp. 1]MCK1395999.1 hypothetical protein [Bradyrhizobium sp. 1]